MITILARIKQGRNQTGYSGDQGRLTHAVPEGEVVALCGAKPGYRSGGWKGAEAEVTCTNCLKAITQGEYRLSTELPSDDGVGF